MIWVKPGIFGFTVTIRMGKVGCKIGARLVLLSAHVVRFRVCLMRDFMYGPVK